MNTIFNLAVLTLLLAAAPSPCFALWGIAPVSKELAKELGMEVRSAPAGPNHVRVELEFKLEGGLKGFSRVDLRVGQGDNPPVTAPLQEDRSKPGRVVVSFTADRAQLDKLTLWVMVPESLGGSIYDLRVKDFVEPKQDPSKDGKKREPMAARTLLEAGQASGSLPEGVVVRIRADLAIAVPADAKVRAEAEARGVDFSKNLKELWEFTADQVHQVVMEEPPHKHGEKFEYVYRRVESRPFDSKGLCKDLIEGKAVEINARKGKGREVMFAGTHYDIGGRSIEILRNGETILHLGEHCAVAGYPESDARAFAALYERLASQARASFKSKAAEAK